MKLYTLVFGAVLTLHFDFLGLILRGLEHWRGA
jgi:hypothetical protein